MSQIVASFDPSSATSGQFSPMFPNGQGRLVVWNKSNIDLIFSWPGCVGAFIPAWQARLLYVKSGSSPITWSQMLILPGQTPDSTVVVELYADSEIIAENYPASLNRSLSQANTIAPNPTASQFFAAKQKGTGPVTISITPVGDGKTLTYLQGFRFITQYGGGTVIEAHVTVQGLAKNSGGSTPIYYGWMNANGGVYIAETFPNPIPATDVYTSIILTTSSYPSGINGCLMAFGYQQIPSS